MYIEFLFGEDNAEAADYMEFSNSEKLSRVLGITSIRAAPSSQIAAVIEL